MSGAHILATGAVSALGVGDGAIRVGEVGQRARVAIDHDPHFERAGLGRPHSARASFASDPTGDRATELLRAALRQCLAALDPKWLMTRVGLAIGTSSGGMQTAERFLAALSRREVVSRDLARGATYFAPLERALIEVRISFEPRALVLGACASSTLAMGLGMRWLDLGRCDVVLAGGFDALSLFVASGFESLRAITASRPNPFRVGRDGMALGEGAGVVALSHQLYPPQSEPAGAIRSRGYLAGFGATTDAVHLTAPDPTGQGLAQAAARAIVDSGLDANQIDLVSAHATATPFNDPAETKAIRRSLGGADPKVVHPFKAQIGHTLGAAGVLESLAAVDALVRHVGPAAAGEGALDAECGVPLFDTQRTLESRAALKLSSAFGGANAALVLTTNAIAAKPARSQGVFLRSFVAISEALDATQIAGALGGRHPHLHRLDPLSTLVASAVHRLSLSVGSAAWVGAGLIVGYALATLEQNELFDQRRRTRGARAVEPRRFPATSPNAAAGECAIAFRLTGPTFAVGGSLHGGLEALAVGRDLVAAGDASSMIVVAADLGGSTSAALLKAAGAPPLPEGACACLLSSEPGVDGVALNHSIPATLSDDEEWIWAGPGGYSELWTYLKGLGR